MIGGTDYDDAADADADNDTADVDNYTGDADADGAGDADADVQEEQTEAGCIFTGSGAQTLLEIAGELDFVALC